MCNVNVLSSGFHSTQFEVTFEDNTDVDLSKPQSADYIQLKEHLETLVKRLL